MVSGKTRSLPDAKVYKLDPAEILIPHIPDNAYQISKAFGRDRLVFTTNQDRIEVLKKVLEMYPGPFFITLVINSRLGALKKKGRMYSDWHKSRIQIDFFLDYFHDFISYGGWFHVWVSCHTTNGIVVYDQHDRFFAYEQINEVTDLLKSSGFQDGYCESKFKHVLFDRLDIIPGHVEMLNYGKWQWAPLEISDVEFPRRWTVTNFYLRFLQWRRTQRAKKKGKS